MKWVYKIVTTQDSFISETELQILGLGFWELISTTHHVKEKGFYFNYIFKKPFYNTH